MPRPKTPRSTKKLYAKAMLDSRRYATQVAFPASWFRGGKHSCTIVSDVGISVVVAGYEDLVKLKGVVDLTLGIPPAPPNREGQ